MMMVETHAAPVRRVPLLNPFTHRETQVTEFLTHGYRAKQIAAILKLQKRTVDDVIHRAAQKVPGDLPAAAKLIAWWRGADPKVLSR